MADWLIVMREELFPETYTFMAEMWGQEAVVCYSGEEAIEWIEAVEADTNRGSLPLFVLMNVFLDGSMQGTVVAKRLRQSPIFYDIAIVLTDTGHYSLEMKEQMMRESDADSFLYLLPRFSEFKAFFAAVVERRQKKISGRK